MTEPEPRDTGSIGGQVPGEPRFDLVPADRNAITGLAPPSAFLEELHAALPIGKVWRRTITVVGRAQDRLLRESEDRARLLRDELEQERVAHARTDERLQNVKGQNGAQLLLQALGGAALGWAGGKLLEGQPSWSAVVVAIAGLLFLAFGSWPFLRARRGRP